VQTDQGPLRRVVVLVVEDDANIATLVRRALEEKGYKVFTAPDGAVALTLLREYGNAIDILFTDVMLPHITGLDLITIAQGQWPNMKLIVCSGQLSIRELAHTGVAFLHKPFTTPELFAVFEQIMLPPAQ
jgi:two-component system cell cycle sensor histidine kinase/response regulator CckA